MTYQGFINKCRTYDLAALIMILGVVQVGLPELGLSQMTAGIINMVISGLVAFMRHITTGPVGEK